MASNSYSGGRAGDNAVIKGADNNKEVDLEYISYLRTRDAWQAIIGTALTVYGLIQQHEMIKRQIQVMERAQAVAEQYLALAQSAYNNIAVPTFERQRDIFDSGHACFNATQCAYLNESQRLKEYQPEYDVQMGRTIAIIQQQFDKGLQQRQRSIGKYASGRCCYSQTWFAIQRTLAVTDAVNHGYRFEEARKRYLDAYYWERQTQGASFLSNWRGQVIGGINGGAQVAIQGLNAVGGAVGRVQEGAAGTAAAYGNMARFWGGVAQMGQSMMGLSAGLDYGAGRTGSSGPYGGVNSMQGNVTQGLGFSGGNVGGGTMGSGQTGFVRIGGGDEFGGRGEG